MALYSHNERTILNARCIPIIVITFYHLLSPSIGGDALGQLWPAPQHDNRRSVYYVFQSSNFHVTISNYSCALLTNAVERYKSILRNMELIYQMNDSMHLGDSGGSKYLKELNIILYSKCEETPHYEMNEKYSLLVANTSVLRSASIWGILRGLETFVQLFHFSHEFHEIHIAGTEIVDYPQYKHRGLLIDTGRHYLSLRSIYQIIEGLAINKMNVLHWHLVDDQSFPYQSDRFPDLSKKGAFTPSMVYTKDDIGSVVEFARDRGVRVIPEIDVPGHARSWGKAYPNLVTQCYRKNKLAMGILDPTKNETFKFLKQLFQEVRERFSDEYVHVGGDEVQIDCWMSTPHIKAYLVKNKLTVRQLQAQFSKTFLPLLPKNTKPIVWQEVFDMNALPYNNSLVQVWWYDWVKEMDRVLKAGHRVIFSSSWYLDYHEPTWQEFYRADPRQMMYQYRRSASGLESLVGGEACMWGERATDSNVLIKVWPRTSSVAERLWTGMDVTFTGDPVTESVRSRMQEHSCRMIRRGLPAGIGSNSAACFGTPKTKINLDRSQPKQNTPIPDWTIRILQICSVVLSISFLYVYLVKLRKYSGYAQVSSYDENKMAQS